MAAFFLDTSALIKRYVSEVGSPWVRSVSDPAAGNLCWLAAVTRVEVVAGLYRRVRVGTLSLAKAHHAETAFRSELGSVFQSLPAGGAVLADAMRLVAAHPLRAYDAIQLASVLSLRARRRASGYLGPIFLCADKTLIAAALAEGLSIDDPNLHP